MKDWFNSWLAGLPSTNYKIVGGMMLAFLTVVFFFVATAMKWTIDETVFGMVLGFVAVMNGYSYMQFAKKRETFRTDAPDATNEHRADTLARKLYEQPTLADAWADSARALPSRHEIDEALGAGVVVDEGPQSEVFGNAPSIVTDDRSPEGDGEDVRGTRAAIAKTALPRARTRKRLSKHFVIEEFERSASHPEETKKIPSMFVGNVQRLVTEVLEPVRARFGGPLRVLSGYRPSLLNSLVSGSPTSAHLRAAAADTTVMAGAKVPNRSVFRAVLARPGNILCGQVIFYPSRNFIHWALPSGTHPKPTFYVHEPSQRLRYEKVENGKEFDAAWHLAKGLYAPHLGD